MMVDTTIYGYVGDGAAYHPDCAPADILPDGDTPVYGLYSSDDTDVHGLSCDGCTLFIFDPVESHAYVAPPAGRVPSWSDTRCWNCGQYRDDELHADDDADAAHDARMAHSTSELRGLDR